MNIGVKVENLSYSFKNQKILDDINIDFYENKIYGLLGKNGAGKTTLLNIITNQLLSKEGKIYIKGVEARKNPSILENICIVREKEYLNEDAKVKDIFDIYFYFYKNYDKKLQHKLCKKFNIDIKKRYKNLSRGLKTLVFNIIGICSNADIVIFDEPTIGLDALNRAEFYDLLLDNYINNPKTIIIATHLIDEVENLLEEVVIINNKKVAVNDSIENLKENSVYISGNKEDLNKLEIIKNKKPIKTFRNNETYAYYEKLSKEELNNIKELSLDIEVMSLNDIFINISKEEIK